jgi:formate dehydrogenase major subunit
VTSRPSDRLPPLLRQIKDPLGLGRAAQSKRSRTLTPRTRDADTVARSVCPYCAVGCGQLIYAKDNKIIDIEGNPDTPHTLGRLCPKGAATIQLSNNPLRPVKALYRAPGSDKWEEKPLEWMYDQIAKRYYDAREKYFIEREKNKDGQEVVVNRLEAIASLGSACIDNEECYLLSKLNRAFGIVYHEHQARV